MIINPTVVFEVVNSKNYSMILTTKSWNLWGKIYIIFKKESFLYLKTFNFYVHEYINTLHVEHYNLVRYVYFVISSNTWHSIFVVMTQYTINTRHVLRLRCIHSFMTKLAFVVIVNLLLCLYITICFLFGSGTRVYSYIECI